MFWIAPAMQYSRPICDTKVPGRYTSISNAVRVGLGTGVISGDGVGAGDGLWLGVWTAAVTGTERAASGDGVVEPAWAAGATIMTEVQPTATMTAQNPA
ncbi:MAG: hypothetical protein ABSE58_04065 [Candidatus Limnocylindrales bacterium]